MSRSQQGSVLNQATGQNATYNANAQTSYNNAQTDEGNFESQLGEYAAANPYVEGGQYQTSTNKVLANTADAGAQSAGNAIQSAAVRTGQNPAGAIAATEAMQEQNERNLSSQEGEATADRIGKQAEYNTNVLNASEQPANFEAQLASQQASAAQGTLNTEEQAAQTPSFEDELGNGLIQAGVSFAGGYGKGLGKP